MRIFGRELEELERLCNSDDDGELDVERREGKSAWMICMDRTADMVGDSVGEVLCGVDSGCRYVWVCS
jgi:hypothetical protein